MPLYIMSIPNIDGGPDLEALFNSIPSKSIVLMEDIDSVQFDMDKKNTKKKKRQSLMRGGQEDKGVSLSSLLNHLDGVSSLEGRVVIMTANAPEVLHRALIRPGRVDKKVYLGHMSGETASAMFMRIMAPVQPPGDEGANDAAHATRASQIETILRDKVPPTTDRKLVSLATQFGNAIPDATFTPAQVQEYLLGHRDDAEMAVAGIDKWVVDEKERMQEELRIAAELKEAEEREEREAAKEEKDFNDDSD